jgi:hypothetical protein
MTHEKNEKTVAAGREEEDLGEDVGDQASTRYKSVSTTVCCSSNLGTQTGA